MMAEGTTFRQLLVARGCQGAASAAIMSGGLSLIAETQPAHSRGRSLAFAYTGLALGVLSGPLVGGLLFERLGRRRTFYLAGSVVLVNALAQMPLLYESPASLLAAEHASAARAPAPPCSSATAYLRLLSHPHVLAVAASTVAINGVLGLLKPLSQLVLDHEFAMGMVARSLVISIATLTYLLATPLVGYLGDRVGPARVVSMSLGLMGLATVFLAQRAHGLWCIYVCCALVGASAAFHGSASQTVLADLVDRHQLGHYALAFALADMSDSLGLNPKP